MSRLRTLLLGFAAGAALLTAGGGEAAISREQLAIMVLPKHEFGPQAARLEVELGSGFVDNAKSAEDSIDPKDTGSDLAGAGRLIGYGLSYGDVSLSALRRRSGISDLGTGCDLFRSRKGADHDFTKTLRDYARLRGKRVDFGVALRSSTSFRVRPLGERAIGLRAQLRIGDLAYYQTFVGFRLGPLSCAAAISRADAKRVDAEAERLAQALERRVRLVLAGKLREAPVPVPSTGQRGVRPPGAPDLAAMALLLSDLPRGVSVSRQGYVDDDNALASYERKFNLGSAVIGRSRLVGLESGVSLLRSAREAQGFFAAARLLYGSRSIEADLSRLLTSEQAGFRVTGVRIEEKRGLKIGHDSLGISVRFTAPASGSFRFAQLFVRVDRVVATLVLVGTLAKFQFEDGVPLARAVAEHIRAGL